MTADFFRYPAESICSGSSLSGAVVTWKENDSFHTVGLCKFIVPVAPRFAYSEIAEACIAGGGAWCASEKTLYVAVSKLHAFTAHNLLKDGLALAGHYAPSSLTTSMLVAGVARMGENMQPIRNRLEVYVPEFSIGEIDDRFTVDVSIDEETTHITAPKDWGHPHITLV